MSLKTRTLGSVAIVAFALLAASAAPVAAKNKLTGTQIQEYNAAATDSARAGWAMQELRGFLADDPDTTHGLLARRIIIRAMFTLNAPASRSSA
jgi:hypothetical protein